MFILPLAHVVHLEGHTAFRWRFAALILGAALLLAYWQGMMAGLPWDAAILLTFVFGYRTFSKAFQDAAARRVTADQAVAVAALAALYVGEYLAAAEVVYIMMVGETLEEYAGRRFQKDLNRLLSCLPHHAQVIREGREVTVHLGEIQAGERVVVYPGQRIPVDGSVLEGESLVDESSITGESVPRERGRGERIFAGTLNTSGRLLIEAGQVGESTVVSRIVELVRHARERKAPIQRTADQYARWFLPLVLVIAAVCYAVTGDIMRSVAILIVACPCAMVLSTPAAVLASVSFLARRGVVVKGGVQLEKLAKVNCVAFDKTGTLTRGRPELIGIESFNGVKADRLLAWAASLETHSEHLLATAIRESAESRGLNLLPVQDVQRHAGLGLEGTVVEGPSAGAVAPLPPGEDESRHQVVLGSARFLQTQGFSLSEAIQESLEKQTAEGSMAVLIGRDRRLDGMLVFRDLPRVESARALHQLRHLGIRRSVLLTGDNLVTAKRVAASVGISEIHADLLPEEKLARLDELQQQGYSVAMVGDGVNDSPSLAAADVGVAMGDTGTDLAAEAAGVVLMGEEALSKLPVLVQASRRTLKIIQDNIFWFGLMINLAAVLAAFAGYLSAITAAILHQISSFLVLMSSLRLLSEPGSWGVFDGLRRRLPTDVRQWPELTGRWGRSWAASLKPRAGALARTGAALIATLYLATGVTIVNPEQKAVVTRFGQLVEEGLEPGLHYRLPWPLEKIHLVEPGRIRSLELGFRIESAAAETEPAAYEWNLQHREGRYTRQTEEAQVLTGDEYLLEVNAVGHYVVDNPADFLFRSGDLENTLRVVIEGALRETIAGYPLDSVLAVDRSGVQEQVVQRARRHLEPLALGVRLQEISLLDVHPALEVVGSFRDVASAMEEKSRRINEAQGYANERVPLARGESEKMIIGALQYRIKRTEHASGEAVRFNDRQRSYREYPRPTAVRLYLETLDEVLAGKRKLILDGSSGRRKIMLLDDALLPWQDVKPAAPPPARPPIAPEGEQEN